jgi:hypothetical protein
MNKIYLFNRVSVLLLATAFFLATPGCKKAVEDFKKENEQDLVVLAMITGKWKMTLFTENGNDILSIWDGYSFQFFESRAVNSIKNGSTTETGSWNGDANAKTMTTNFGANTDPNQKLNGVWNITRNGWSFVEASLTLPNGTTRTLKLVRE